MEAFQGEARGQGRRGGIGDKKNRPTSVGRSEVSPTETRTFMFPNARDLMSPSLRWYDPDQVQRVGVGGTRPIDALSARLARTPLGRTQL